MNSLSENCGQPRLSAMKQCKRSKRTDALDLIRVEVVMNGEVTHEAMRAYIENRISKAAFDEAVAVGMQQHANQGRK